MLSTQCPKTEVVCAVLAACPVSFPSCSRGRHVEQGVHLGTTMVFSVVFSDTECSLRATCRRSIPALRKPPYGRFILARAAPSDIERLNYGSIALFSVVKVAGVG